MKNQNLSVESPSEFTMQFDQTDLIDLRNQTNSYLQNISDSSGSSASKVLVTIQTLLSQFELYFPPLSQPPFSNAKEIEELLVVCF